MAFERDIAGFAYVETFYGDDLRRVALRSLGDASLWPDIAAINALLPPYLTDDPAQVGPGVLLTGSVLLVPAPQLVDGITEDPDAVFGIDLDLTGGAFSFANGGPVLVSGWANFVQSIRLRIQSHKRDLMFHPDYGSLVHSLLGQKNGPTANSLAAFYARSAMLDDNRVADVPACTATMLGDTITIVATVMGVSGKTSNVTMVV